MKFNFRKIASILATTVMLGSTVAFATAAWPAPFVKTDGSADAALVVGTLAQSSDMDSATDLAEVLNAKVTVSTGTSTASEGDKFKIEKSNDKFNLGNNINSFYTTIDNEDLTKVLANGVYTNDANNEFDYEQSINLGSKTLTFFQSDDFNSGKPAIGLAYVSGDPILNYTLEFTPDAAEGGGTVGTSTAFQDLETTDLTMLGVSYYVLKAENTTTGLKLTLLDNANTATVSEGEDANVKVGTTNYDVKIDYIASGSTILEVNGVKTNKLSEGDVFKVGTDTYVAVKNILYNSKESGVSQVEFSVGSGKIILDNGKELQMNDKAISDSTNMILNAYITTSSTDVSKIKLEWIADDDFWVAPGSDLLLPGFKTIKLSMAGFNAPKQEVTTLKASSDTTFDVKTTIKDGDIDLPILYNNNSEILGLGEKAKHKLITSAGNTATVLGLNETEKDYFVATYIDGDNGYTYAYQLDSITDSDGKNATVLKNLAGGSDLSFSEVGKSKDVQDLTFTLQAANEKNKSASINVTSSGSGTVYFDRVVTKEGLWFRLPVDTTTSTADGNINITAGAHPSTWSMNFTEEDKDGNIAKGKSATATLGINADDGLQPDTLAGGVASSSMYETEDSSNQYLGYISSDLATKFLWDKPSSALKSLTITYAGEQSTADVYVSEAAVTFSGSNTIQVFKDSEVASLTDKNLIVVGGACVNTVAAKMIGSDTPVCGAAWAAATNAGVGKYLVKVAANPYASASSGKMAMLVAGYEAADTKAAKDYVKQGTVDASTASAYVGPVNS